MLSAFAIQENGVLHRVSEPLADAQWIDLLAPSPGEIAQVVDATDMVIPTETAINEIESSSRLATRDGVLYLNLPLVKALTEPRAFSVGFILSAKKLVTVRFEPSLVFDHFMAHQTAPCLTASHILIGLLEAVIDRQADALEEVKSELEVVSHQIFSERMVSGAGRKSEDKLLRHALTTLGRIGDLISHIRESQVEAGRIVPYLELAAASWLPQDLHGRLQTLRRDIASLNDYDTHLNDKLQFLLDATLGFINMAQNNVMKVLTVVSVVGIPPVLVAGIYGMNFKTMPELDWSWGYAYGLAVIVLTGLIPLALFKWRDWI